MPQSPLPVQVPRGTGAIRDTIAAVFRQHAYDRSTATTLWDRFWDWLGRLLTRGLTAAQHSPATRWTVLAVAAVLIVLVVVRVAYLHRYGRAQARAAEGAFRSLGLGDPWTEAEALARDGRYTDAAHAIYGALLRVLERRERVRLHPSRTTGDYVRDLRARSSSLLGRFRDFTRAYETVVYGFGACDRERYERLRGLAAPLVAPHA